MPRCLFEHKIGISVVWPERVSRFDIQIGAGISLQYPLKARKKLVVSYTPLSPKLAVRWELRSRRTSEPPPFNFSLMAALPARGYGGGSVLTWRKIDGYGWSIERMASSALSAEG